MFEKLFKYLGMVWIIIVGVGIIYGFIRFLLGLEVSDWLMFLIIAGAFLVEAIIRLFRRVSSLEKRLDQIERNG